MLPAFIYQIEFNKHVFSEETSSKTWNTDEVMILWKECAINHSLFLMLCDKFIPLIVCKDKLF